MPQGPFTPKFGLVLQGQAGLGWGEPPPLLLTALGLKLGIY